MSQQPIDIPFPLGGLNRRVGYQSSDKATTPHSLNVFPDDSVQSRTRGGARPGLTRRYPQSIDGDIRLLLPVSSINTGDEQTYQYLAVGSSASLYISQVQRQVGSLFPTQYIETLRIIPGVTIPAGQSQAVGYKGQIVVAGAATVLASGTGTITNNTFTSAAVSNWSSIDPANHVVKIVDDTHLGTYQISAVLASSLQINSQTPIASATVQFEIVPAAKIIDPQTATVTIMRTQKGVIPTNAKSLAVYRDRLVWAEGRVWYMSRQGDIYDYDYSADSDDGGRAVAAVNSTAGQPGDPIVAIAVGGDDYLVMFSEDTTWVLRGDPTYGGKLYNLSQVVGCVGPKAWCYGPQDEIYFLAKTGLYSIGSDVDQPPQPISDVVLPQELKRITSANYNVALAYDSSDTGIAIFLTPSDGSNGIHWWFDLGTKSLWPMQMTTAGQQPSAVCSFTGTPSRQQKLLLACRDGTLREFNGILDDGQDINSYIVLGPFATSDNFSYDGVITEILLNLGTESIQTANVTLKVFTGSSAQAAVNSAVAGNNPVFSFLVQATPSSRLRERVRGAFFCVRLDAIGPWSFEGMTAFTAISGRNRLTR
jgi:hypothetical protein